MTNVPKTLDDIFARVVIREAWVINFENNDYIAVWAECYNNDELDTGFIAPAYLTIIHPDGIRVQNWDVESAVKQLAMSARVDQIRQEAGLVGGVKDTETISLLLDRVWAGEWMGQFNDARNIYIQELSSLLGLTFSETWPIVDMLVTLRLADVLPSSYTLIAPRGKEVLKSTFEFNGHKEYQCSDFGYWSCAACGNRGDDYADSADFECVE